MGLVPAFAVDLLVVGVHRPGDHECRQNEHERHDRGQRLSALLPLDARALGAPLGTGLLPFGDAFNADAISGPDILDDLMN